MENERAVQKASVFFIFISAPLLIFSGEIIRSFSSIAAFVTVYVLSLPIFVYPKTLVLLTKNKVPCYIFTAFSVCLSLAAAIFISLKYTEFAAQTMLPTTDGAFVCLALLTVCVILSYSEIKALYKLAFLTAAADLLISVYLFISSVSQMRADSIYGMEGFSFSEFIKYCGFFFVFSVLPALAVKFFFTEESAGAVSSLGGEISALIFSGIVSANCLFFFGSGLSSEFKYPYYNTVNTINHARLFSRVNEFAFFIYVSLSIMFISLSFFVIRKAAERINEKVSKAFPVISGAAAFIFYVIIR